jgi:nitroreductase
VREGARDHPLDGTDRRRAEPAQIVTECALERAGRASSGMEYACAVDVGLAIASKRDERRYAPDRPLPDELVERILDAGRLAGSSKNRQPWRFLVVEGPERREALAEAVFAPGNVRSAALVVAICMPGGRGGLDAGRAAQNMMLAAWGAGVISCPNGFADADAAAAALGLEGAEVEPLVVLTFGYPLRPREPGRRSVGEWSASAERKPLDAVVERV